jgi:hypothetical protein
MMRAGRLFITLPNGNRTSLGEYVRSWRILKGMHGDKLVGRFSHFPQPARSVLEEISRGMHDRINRHIPGYGVGRKWHDDWQRETANAARALNTPRLAIHWLPKWIAAKFPDREWSNV